MNLCQHYSRKLPHNDLYVTRNLLSTCTNVSQLVLLVLAAQPGTHRIVPGSQAQMANDSLQTLGTGKVAPWLAAQVPDQYHQRMSSSKCIAQLLPYQLGLLSMQLQLPA